MLALLARLLLIALTDGGFDLRLYHHFAELAATGLDPYVDPGTGALAGRPADNPPLFVLLFAAVLKLHGSVEAIRVVLAVADVTTILIVGLSYPRPRPWRAALITFLAFNPFVLEAWTATSEDKTLIFCLFALVMVALERGQPALAWAATTALGAFKWIGAAFVVPLAVWTGRARSRRAAMVGAVAFIGLFVFSSVPYSPDSLEALDYRRDRLGLEPIHASLTQFLAELGMYDHCCRARSRRLRWPRSICFISSGDSMSLRPWCWRSSRLMSSFPISPTTGCC